MNNRNTEFFFGDDDHVVLTLTDEDGHDMEAQVMAAFEIEELGTEYLMAVALSEDGDGDGGELSGEVHALRYQEDINGEPEIFPIEDEEEMELVSQAIQEILENGDFGELEFVEEEEEVTDDNYLDDIGTIFPGISIDKEE